MNRITAGDVITEYGRWLAEQPPSPAREWALANPPGTETAQRILSTQRLAHKFMVALYGRACETQAVEPS
jgi:hypothetical protein